eukprot:TRINITY_DN11710_c0_g1_i2.p2 TRINITY_DN11710_c0_g1~~TRINITY_DN11710_c0_g1_i2.p2  ORF type:complete len:121 (-),score=41.43 TRINITY_DN11710_c0_g1_i2:1197-1559(-)
MCIRDSMGDSDDLFGLGLMKAKIETKEEPQQEQKKEAKLEGLQIKKPENERKSLTLNFLLENLSSVQRDPQNIGGGGSSGGARTSRENEPAAVATPEQRAVTDPNQSFIDAQSSEEQKPK